MLPSGELTHAHLDAGPKDEGMPVVESIGMGYQNFAVLLDYVDAGDRARGAVRLDVANSQYPHITGRRWADSVA